MWEVPVQSGLRAEAFENYVNTFSRTQILKRYRSNVIMQTSGLKDIFKEHKEVSNCTETNLAFHSGVLYLLTWALSTRTLPSVLLLFCPSRSHFPVKCLWCRLFGRAWGGGWGGGGRQSYLWRLGGFAFWVWREREGRGEGEHLH